MPPCTDGHLAGALRVIAAPTDEAWNDARVSLGMKPTRVADPDNTKNT
jgi:hypothetical protein